MTNTIDVAWIGVLLATIAVANRHPVRLALDPFDAQNPVIALQLPFYAYLFAMLIVGVLLGVEVEVHQAARKLQRHKRDGKDHGDVQHARHFEPHDTTAGRRGRGFPKDLDPAKTVLSSGAACDLELIPRAPASWSGVGVQ